jgi:hypothetical protein
MKKILVVLLILAVAGGVFAQGNWSLSGNAEIGTILNFYDDGVTEQGKIGGHAYHRYEWWSDITGTLSLGYNRDGLSVGLGFDAVDLISASMEFDGGNYRFATELPLINMLGSWVNDGTGVNRWVGTVNGIGRLWGWYKLVNNMIHLEAAVKSADTNFWISAETVGEVFGWDPFRNGLRGSGQGWGFASVDGDNYLLADFAFAGLNFGIMLPQVFNTTGTAIGGGWPITSEGYHPYMEDWTYVNFVEDVATNAVVGLKFSMSPIEAALQFDMSNYGAYIGAKAGIGDSLTAEFSFEGTFEDKTVAAAAAGIGFNAGAFSANLKAGVSYDDDLEGLLIGVRPGFTFNVIPSHLAFRLDAGFWFSDDDFDWAFMPQLFWNFKGTGYWGADYWAFDTGFIIRYVMQRDSYNAVDLTFKWNF